ncbi:MAG: RNA-directed DNA polymerase [Vampirovibrionales bacterium]
MESQTIQEPDNASTQEKLSVVHSENKNSKSILELTHDEAHQYFLKQESFCDFDLPEYFKFEALLNSVDKILTGKNLSDFRTKNPRNCEGVNYKILNNKDGKYAWRPLQLINPALYVSLVHKITSKENWKLIRKRFTLFSKNKKIECVSIPRQSLTENSDKAEQISNWWQHIEQRSIELALDYSYLTHTDLTDCYGAIYTHSVAWAIHGKEEAKENRNEKSFVGNQIDGHLQDMSHGQTNGIPQGSTLMDFIAEMVLGYADLELTKHLKNKKITDYKILRYRDDYRIFSNSPINNDLIIKCLTEVMIDLGLKLSTEKTGASTNVIKGAIKADKLYWMQQKQTKRDLQKYLLIIHDLSIKFPNCGSLSTALKDFYNKLRKRKKINNTIIPLLSIITDIAHKNPRTYQYSAAIISLLLQFEQNESQKVVLLGKIVKKFKDIPNTGHLDIWLQRVALGIKGDMVFQESLCRLSAGETVAIWNTDWLEGDLKNTINVSSIVDQDFIANLPEIITKDEVALFKNEFNSTG